MGRTFSQECSPMPGSGTGRRHRITIQSLSSLATFLGHMNGERGRGREGARRGRGGIPLRYRHCPSLPRPSEDYRKTLPQPPSPLRRLPKDIAPASLAPQKTTERHCPSLPRPSEDYRIAKHFSGCFIFAFFAVWLEICKLFTDIIIIITIINDYCGENLYTIRYSFSLQS